MLVLGLATCLGVLLILLWLLPGRLHPEAFAQIKPGMTRAEVEALVGGPPGDYGSYFISPSRGFMSTGLVIGPPGSVEERWCDDHHLFYVFFDRAGYATGGACDHPGGYHRCPPQGLGEWWLVIRHKFGCY
jgi:hypothetical protein